LCNGASRLEISAFLEKSKKLVSAGKCEFIPRDKNMQALAKIGLTILDAKEEILDLKITDYYKGPKKDFDQPGDIWEFKTMIRGIRFYIKIKVAFVNESEVLKCIGFHVDEF
jgi:hypothetical protein